MGNSFTTSSSSTVTVSSEAVLYPASNLQNTQRYKHWAGTGRFTVPTGDLSLYIDSGTYNLTAADYLTGTLLAAHITTVITATGITCTYNSDYTFTFSKGSAFTMEFSTSSGMWDLLGFTATVDETGLTSRQSEEIRIHTDESIDWDLGSDIKTTFFSLISKREGGFPLSSSAVVTLEADSVPIGASPALSITLSVGTEGIYEFLDDNTDHTHRYWKLTIQDRENALGSSGLKFGIVYLGDYITLTSRGVERGFKKIQIDPSLKNTSESGATYYKIKNRFTRFSNLSMPYLTASDRREIEDFFYDKGNFTPFFLSIDPMLGASSDLQELTKYVKFDGDPIVTHVKQDVYTVQFNAVEDL